MKRHRNLPVVFSRVEVDGLLTRLEGTHNRIASRRYGTGMRLLEGLRLRVQVIANARAKWDMRLNTSLTTDRNGRGEHGPAMMIRPLRSGSAGARGAGRGYPAKAEACGVHHRRKPVSRCPKGSPGSTLENRWVRSRHASDLLVVGHTHQVYAERLGGTLVINPGSTLFNHSCAVLHLPAQRVEWFAVGGAIRRVWNWGDIARGG